MLFRIKENDTEPGRLLRVNCLVLSERGSKFSPGEIKGIREFVFLFMLEHPDVLLFVVSELMLSIDLFY